MNVALGGTFDPVHDGHRALFRHGLERGDLTVGLTTDELAPKTRHEDRPIRSFDARRRDLDGVLSELAAEYDQEYTIRPLERPTGIATEPQFDVLIVSPETKEGGEQINEIRRENGYEPLDVEVVDHVYAEDGRRVSSTRIVRGEIDEHGNLTPGRDGRTVADTES